MRHSTGFLHRSGHGCSAGFEAPIQKIQFDDMREIALIQNDLLSIHTGKWCIVLVNTMHGDTINRSARPIGKCLLPLDVSVVEQSCPVDNADHDWLTGSHQDIANGFE